MKLNEEDIKNLMGVLGAVRGAGDLIRALEADEVEIKKQERRQYDRLAKAGSILEKLLNSDGIQRVKEHEIMPLLPVPQEDVPRDEAIQIAEIGWQKDAETKIKRGLALDAREIVESILSAFDKAGFSLVRDQK